MSRYRIYRLYLKDLLDIVRDRRTLVAMIVVPLVLYPLIMLGSLQAVSIQMDNIKSQEVHIAVQTENVAAWLNDVLVRDASRFDDSEEETLDTNNELKLLDTIDNFKIYVFNEVDLSPYVQSGQVHTAVQFDPKDLPIQPGLWKDKPIRPRVITDTAVIRSEQASRRIERALQRRARYLVEMQARDQNWSTAHIYPIEVEEVDVASAEKRGGSMLGQIIPMILILLTMTGAIYPAIDLTAGERERGTLETLLASPVPITEIISAKFLVVATISIIGAALNLASMGLTFYFGGFEAALALEGEAVIPLFRLPAILLCLLPLTFVFSGVLLAVCSFARTFKEAQTYILPVVIVVLLPAGLAALPGSELEGYMLVLPVANMVLLTRELLLGTGELGSTVCVMLSNCLYAAAAVVIAIRVFGQEAVVFNDAGSWRTQLNRRLMKPQKTFPLSVGVMYVAIMFPVWFYCQNALSMLQWPFVWAFSAQQACMVLLFALLPWLLMWYCKIRPQEALNLRHTEWKYYASALLMGLGTWIVAHELLVFQKSMSWFGLTDQWIELLKPFSDQVRSMSPLVALALLAIVPGICEELLFRGMMQSSLRHATTKWISIVAVAGAFAVFHFAIQRMMITFLLGLLLAYLCWQSYSVWPAIIAHIMHNAINILRTLPDIEEPFNRWLGIPIAQKEDALTSLPAHLVVMGVVCVLVGLLLCRRQRRTTAP